MHQLCAVKWEGENNWQIRQEMEVFVAFYTVPSMPMPEGKTVEKPKSG